MKLFFRSFSGTFSKTALLLLVFLTMSLSGQLAPRHELGEPLVVTEPPGADEIGPRAPYSNPSWIDTSNRTTVKTAYDTIFAPTTPTAVSWTGSVSSNIPGTTAQAYRDAVLTRINWFRAMAGVPADIAFDSTYSMKNQKAALMMSANNQLSHYPPTSWRNWTQDGYDAAGKSNICYGTSYPSEYLSGNPGCVQGYMDDDGSNNTAVGHRRWLLVPQTQYMGTGDVTQTPLGSSSPTYGSANTIWVQDGHYSDARPATRDTFVAWPPKGYVPYQVVPNRWSVSYGSANFNSANVTMSVGGSNVPLTKLTVQPSSGYIGENTLVWEPSTDFTVQPSADRTVLVTVTGVSGYPGGSTIQYSVTIFNPAQGATLQPPVLVSPANGATSVGTSGLTLSWNTASGATSYDIYVGSANPPPNIGNTTSTSTTLSGVIGGTTYYWKIVAKDGSTTASSAIWSFTTAGSGPATPVLSSPANGATGVSTSSALSWGSASGATSYDVYWGTSNPPPYVTNTGGVSYSPALAAATTYYWKVVSKNSSGSASSSVWSFTTATGGPGTPALNSPASGATGVATNASLSWSSASGATSYDVHIGTANPPPYVTNTGGLSYSPALSSGTTYYWKIVARNSAGTASSSVRSFTTVSGGPSTPTLVSPANAATGVARTSLQLSWNAASGATSYDVYVGSSNPPPYSGNVTGTSTTITSTLSASTVYYWQIVAKNSSGSAPSSIRYFTTAGLIGPGGCSLLAPANGATGISRTNLQLSWTAASGATSYDVYMGSTNPPPYSGNVSGTTATVTSTLTANHVYYWQVVALNSGGSTPSAVWSFTTAGSGPGAFTLVSPANGATGVAQSGLQLSWNTASGATSYDVYLGSSTSPSYSGTVSGTTASVTSTLSANTTYYWYIIANSTGGTSTSVTWSFTTAGSGPVPPSQPLPPNTATGVSLTTSLTWNPSSGATSYDVYFGSSNPPPMVMNTSSLSYTPIGLTYGTTYYWKVAARSGSGTGTSSIWSFTTGTNGGAPTGLRFVALTPCRLVDTRPAYAGSRTGAFGPPMLSATATRTIPIPSSATCTVPSTAKAYVLNLTLDTYENQTGPVDFVTLWPTGETRPDFYTARTSTGGYIANAAIVKAGSAGAINVYSSSNVNLILDISGYFTDDPGTAGLLYYPINPCRAVDTRGPIYSSLPPPYGNQRMQAKENRSFRLPGSPACQIPVAAAYSMQLTLAPGELTNGDPVAFITAYPSGLSQPNISNMNALFGYAVANSAIVPASGNGSIDVYAFDATNLIIDVNGYFAPDDGSGRGLQYFPVTQCRVMNTQDSSFTGAYGPPAISPGGDRTVAVPAGRCGGLPTTAQAWAMNASVVPNGAGMPYLSMWPSGTGWPNVSQLNAFQGQMLANSGIVPAGANGSIDVRVAGTTHVLLEVSGYFSR